MKKIIVFIEDTVTQHQIFGLILGKDTRIEIVECYDEPAIDLVRNADAVLCDVRLSEQLCGLELSRKYREYWPEKPVGVLTTSRRDEIEIPAGVAYFDKMKPMILLQSIQDWLGLPHEN